MIKEVVLEVRTENPFRALSEKYNSRIRVADCKDVNSRSVQLLLEIEGSDAENLAKELKDSDGVRHMYYGKPKEGKILALAVVDSPLCCRVARSTSSFCVSCPLNETEPESTWRLWTSDMRGLKRMLSMLEEFGAESKLKSISDGRHDDRLTPRQREILEVAMKRGYFEFPRKTDLAKLGQELSITAATTDEILRRAEHKITMQYLQSVKA